MPRSLPSSFSSLPKRLLPRTGHLDVVIPLAFLAVVVWYLPSVGLARCQAWQLPAPAPSSEGTQQVPQVTHHPLPSQIPLACQPTSASSSWARMASAY